MILLFELKLYVVEEIMVCVVKEVMVYYICLLIEKGIMIVDMFGVSSMNKWYIELVF